MKGWVGLVGWPAGHSSDAGRVQDRESSPAKDRRSTTVPRHTSQGVKKWREKMTKFLQRALVLLVAPSCHLLGQRENPPLILEPPLPYRRRAAYLTLAYQWSLQIAAIVRCFGHVAVAIRSIEIERACQASIQPSVASRDGQIGRTNRFRFYSVWYRRKCKDWALHIGRRTSFVCELYSPY